MSDHVPICIHPIEVGTGTCQTSDVFFFMYLKLHWSFLNTIHITYIHQHNNFTNKFV